MRIDWQSSETLRLLNPRLTAAEAAQLRESARLLPDLAGHVWITTSGTTTATGRFKWVALSKQAILASAASVNRHLEATVRDVWVHALPSFHVGGLGIWARADLSGSEVRELEKWDAHAFMEVASGATLSALVPTQVFDLVQAGLRAPASLRAVIIGGAALNESLYQSARTLGWNLLPSYGMSETASQIATASLATLPGGEMPRTLTVLPHAEVEIRGGRIAVRATSLFSGYVIDGEWIDPKVEGWFLTEDRGALPSPGQLRIIGRADSFVKIGGESVELSKLEEIFESLKGALDAVLVALPDERLGSIVALVHASGALDEITALQTAFNERVLPFERIRSVHPVEQIPRSPLGKLLKAQLLEQLSGTS